MRTMFTAILAMEKTILITLILSLLIISCAPDFSDHWPYHPPENMNDGLDVGTLEEVNIETEMIAKAVGRIYQDKYDEVHSMLIFKDGMLVFEEYYEGHTYDWEGANYHGELVAWDMAMSHCVHSVTKSITSTCIGIAIDHGFIQSVHQSIFDYLPEHQHLATAGKDEITIEHLLTMTSGLEWDEWGVSNSSMDNDIIGIWFSEKDPISYILEKPLLDEPGTNFTYSGGNMILLGEIIRYATEMNIDEFSEQYLFEPLGIDSANWALQFENGVIEAGGGLKITPRAMVKIGVTFLNEGIWNGTRIISEQWVEKSATAFLGNQGIDVPGDRAGEFGYSYSWWINSIVNSGSMFSAGGWGGQHIMVIPKWSTVVIFTGGNYTSDAPPFEILERFILPAFD